MERPECSNNWPGDCHTTVKTFFGMTLLQNKDFARVVGSFIFASEVKKLTAAERSDRQGLLLELCFNEKKAQTASAPSRRNGRERNYEQPFVEPQFRHL